MLTAESGRSLAGDVSIPASAFGIILGLIGLANCWKVAHVYFGLSIHFYFTILYASIAIWAYLIVMFFTKWMNDRQTAMAEFNHPILCCFIGLVPISTILVGAGVHELGPAIGAGLIVSGTLAQLAFSAFRGGGMLTGGRAVVDTTAVMYLPTVGGGFVSAIGMSVIGCPELSRLFFGAGLLSWLALESVVTFRLYHADPLPPGLRPTMGIQIAPPFVGSVAYLSAYDGSVDAIFYSLYGYGLLQTLLLLRMLRWIVQIGPNPGFWAFGFGVTAMGAACLRAAIQAPASLLAHLAIPVFISVNLFMAVLVAMTMRLFLQRKLFRK